MSSFLQDVRHALRALSRNAGFTAVVALTLALGIGGNATIFSVLRASLFSGLPYPEPDRLVALDLTNTTPDGTHDFESWSFPKYETMLQNVSTIELITARRGGEVILAGGVEPARAYVEATTAEYFTLFGARAVRGRVFTPSDNEAGGPAVAVLPYSTWRQQFGGDSLIVGRTVRVNGVPVEVVGVTKPGFRGVSGRVDVWVPIRSLPALGYGRVLERRWAHSFTVFGRLKAGVTIERAQAEMAVVGRAVDAAHPQPENTRTIWGATAVQVSQVRANPEFRTVFGVLAGAVALVLLLACVNVANMLLARAAGRERELVIRAALGAGRGRLTRHLVVESTMLGLIGGAVGLGLAIWGIDVLAAIVPRTTGGHGVLYFDPGSLSLDTSVIAFTAAVALVTGVVMGLVPAWRFSRPEGSTALREGAGTVRGLGSLRRPTLRGGLVVVEVALAVVLLAGAGLMIRTLANLSAVRPGFDAQGVLSFRYRLPPNDPRASDPAFHQTVLDRMAGLPGVRSAAMGACPPLSGCYDYNSLSRIDGGQRIPDDEQPMIRTQFVSDDFFRTLGVAMLAGRSFGPADRPGSEPVIVVNRTTAERFFPKASALDRGMSVSNGLTKTDSTARIVGVVGDVRYQSLQEPPTPEVYVSLRQMPTSSPAVYLRTAGDPVALVPAVRAALHELAPDAPINEVTTLPQLVAAATASERLVAWSLVGFAVLALVLASLGVYGVVSFSVGQRRREVAVRMALGAEPARVLRQIFQEGMGLIGFGALIGFVGAVLASTALRKLLYGVAPRDPLTLFVILVLLLAVAGAATLLPARRAAASNPMTALRAD